MGTFEVTNEGFLLNGAPFQLISGAIHYFRVPPAYWRDRLAKLKNMGCNTVEMVIPWNVHERVQGKFEFDGWRDVAAFIRLAGEIGLYALLRPSPYICAEWEFGGYPSWLLREDGARLRCSDEKHMAHVARYCDELIPRIAPLQITRGGNVLMMQIENEYGSYGDDTKYLEMLRDGLRDRGIDVPLFTSDNPEYELITCGRVDGALPTGNFGSHSVERFRFMSDLGLSPLVCMEFWVGWFDNWGCGAHHTTDAKACAEEYAHMLENGHVNIYMFHGGTNFGFMNGSNDYDELASDVTSYDYDAVLTEDGRETEKYRLFKQALEKHLGKPIAAVDCPPIPRKSYGKARLVGASPLFSLLDGAKRVHSLTPRSMERLGQDVGYILYRSTLDKFRELKKIELSGAADRAQVFLNGKPILTLHDRQLLSAHKFDQPLPLRVGDEIAILVENMGRVNYGYKMEKQRKGIDGAVILNDRQHYGWDIVCMDEAFLAKLAVSEDDASVPGAPCAYRYQFGVDYPGDTFVSLDGFGKGVCFINGFCLGRFWEIGPQKRLYLPAPFLKAGENELLILETEGKHGEVTLTDTPSI